MTDFLDRTSTGRWLITTQGSQHILDLDAGTWKRIPGEGRSSFSHDDEVLEFTRIEAWPRVGSIFRVVFDDPGMPDYVEHWRQSSTIKSIEEMNE